MSDEPYFGIPADYLLIPPTGIVCVNLDIRLATEGDGIVIAIHYQSTDGDIRHGATLGLARTAAVALMTRLSEVIR